MAHFEFTGETLNVRPGRVLHQIRATKDIPHHNIKSGDVGGFIEKAGNLPSEDAWVASGMVYGNAVVANRALVEGNSRVFGNAVVSGRARLSHGAMVAGDAIVSEDAAILGGDVRGSAIVRGDAVAEVEDDTFRWRGLGLLRGSSHPWTRHPLLATTISQQSRIPSTAPVLRSSTALGTLYDRLWTTGVRRWWCATRWTRR